MLTHAGCILEGDYFFALKQRGKVSKKYINIDPIFTDSGAMWKLGYRLTHPFGTRFNCIVGPAVGGIPLVYASALAAIDDRVNTPQGITTAFAEKDGDGFVFARMGFKQAVRGKQVLIVEDISSTGNSTKAVCDLVRKAGGELVGVSMIWNRGDVTLRMLGVPTLIALINERVEMFEIDNNPPGWGELPLVSDIGHPDYYPDYPGPRISLLAA